MPVKHLFVSAKADKADDSLVRPSDWNEDHVIEFDINEISANYSVVSTDEVILVDTSIRNITVTMPALQDFDKRIFCVKKISTLNTLDIVGSGSDKIDKQTCYTVGVGVLNNTQLLADYANSTWWVL